MTAAWTPTFPARARSPAAGPAGGCKLSTLIRLRWLAVGGQTAAILVVGLWFEFPLPIGACFALISLSAWLNLGLRLVFPAAYRLDPNWAALLLAYDLLQLAGLLYLTGGLENPFAILLLGPVMVSATTLPPDKTFLLGAMTLAAATVLVFMHEPLPWFPGQDVRRAAPLCRRRLGGARLRARLHGLLRVPRGGGGAPARRRARRDRAGAAARAAPFGARRARRRRGARARHAARHDRARRPRAGQRDAARTIRAPRTSG